MLRRVLGAVIGLSLGLVLGLATLAGSQGAATIANWPNNALHVICDSGCSGGPGGGLTDAQLRATPVPVSGSVTASGTVAVSNFPATQPVSGTVAVSNFPATQPVSGTVTATGPLTDGQLRATPVPVSGTLAATQSGTWTVQPGNTPNTSAWLFTLPPTSLGITALSGANAAVTATLPAVASQFHYITSLRIMRTCTAAITGTAALAVTTTNLPGTMAWTTGNACAVGSTNEVLSHDFASPVRSSVVNTNTTIVCPALGAAGICRITVHYYTAI